MTGENRKTNIAESVARADEAFREARGLIDLRLPNGAVSRAYYAAFHMARAALLTRGLEAKTHAGMQKLVARELTAKGVLPSFGKLLGDIQKARETADYDAAISFTLDEAREVLEEAERFSSVVTELLKREGWIVQ
jgi:uncharacterized protein (UPF0332 family)